MLPWVLSFLTGRAAKAGVALITGALTTVGGAGAVDAVSDAGMTLVGYVVIGAAGGFINWATVYFKANKPSGGLY